MIALRRAVRVGLVAVCIPLLVATVFPQGVAPVQQPPMINQSNGALTAAALSNSDVFARWEGDRELGPTRMEPAAVACQ